MDKIPADVIKSIKDFLSILEKNNIHIEKAVLFGSYARGGHHEYSDIDLAIVSDSFTRNRFMDKEMIRKYINAVNTDISPMPFMPTDFNDDNVFACEVLRNGIEIPLI